MGFEHFDGMHMDWAPSANKALDMWSDMERLSRMITSRIFKEETLSTPGIKGGGLT